MRVLIVEDDMLLGEGLFAGLREHDCAIDWVTDADQASHSLSMEQFDLMILDLGLPGRDGLDFLRDVRHRRYQLPVLILSARDEVGDRIKGLDAGADDYMVKPFDLDELNARLRALIRRSKGCSSAVMSAGNLSLDPAPGRVTLDGQPLELSPKEYGLLHTLIAHVEKVVSRTALMESAYSWNDEIASNALEVHIHNLRRKVGRERIRTVRGVGYCLTANTGT